MKKWILCIALLFVCSCSFDLMTEENPLGLIDPNTGAAFFEAGLSAANAGQVVGTATGNPLLIGGSVIAGIVIAALGGSYLKGKKK